MSYADYIISFGDCVDVEDITDRVTGIVINHRCEIGSMPIGTAIITVRNDDGIFTPGIGKTYSSVDWFSQAIFIDKGSATYPLFHGIIDDIQFADNGVNSQVTISCVDALTVGGRGIVTESTITNITRQAHTLIENMYNGVTVSGTVIYEPVGMPALGGTTPVVDFDVLSENGTGYPQFTANSVGTNSKTVKDVINNGVMPSYDMVAWPTTIDVSGGYAEYSGSFVYQSTRDNPTVFQFGGANIPFSVLESEYRTDLLYNVASATDSQSFTGSAINQTSIDKYGGRNVIFSALDGDSASWQLGSGTRAVDYITEMYVNRFSTVRYTPSQMTVLLEAAEEANIAEATMHSLMSVTAGLWQLAEITYKPAGATSNVTEVSVIAGRTILAVPGRTEITLELLPAADYQLFVLDSTTLGVLDTNRLG